MKIWGKLIAKGFTELIPQGKGAFAEISLTTKDLASQLAYEQARELFHIKLEEGVKNFIPTTGEPMKDLREKIAEIIRPLCAYNDERIYRKADQILALLQPIPNAGLRVPDVKAECKCRIPDGIAGQICGWCHTLITEQPGKAEYCKCSGMRLDRERKENRCLFCHKPLYPTEQPKERIEPLIIRYSDIPSKVQVLSEKVQELIKVVNEMRQ